MSDSRKKPSRTPPPFPSRSAITAPHHHGWGLARHPPAGLPRLLGTSEDTAAALNSTSGLTVSSPASSLFSIARTMPEASLPMPPISPTPLEGAMMARQWLEGKSSSAETTGPVRGSSSWSSPPAATSPAATSPAATSQAAPTRTMNATSTSKVSLSAVASSRRLPELNCEGPLPLKGDLPQVASAAFCPPFKTVNALSENLFSPQVAVRENDKLIRRRGGDVDEEDRCIMLKRDRAGARSAQVATPPPGSRATAGMMPFSPPNPSLPPAASDNDDEMGAGEERRMSFWATFGTPSQQRQYMLMRRAENDNKTTSPSVSGSSTKVANPQRHSSSDTSGQHETHSTGAARDDANVNGTAAPTTSWLPPTSLPLSLTPTAWATAATGGPLLDRATSDSASSTVGMAFRSGNVIVRLPLEPTPTSDGGGAGDVNNASATATLVVTPLRSRWSVSAPDHAATSQSLAGLEKTPIPRRSGLGPMEHVDRKTSFVGVSDGRDSAASSKRTQRPSDDPRLETMDGSVEEEGVFVGHHQQASSLLSTGYEWSAARGTSLTSAYSQLLLAKPSQTNVLAAKRPPELPGQPLPHDYSRLGRGGQLTAAFVWLHPPGMPGERGGDPAAIQRNNLRRKFLKKLRIKSQRACSPTTTTASSAATAGKLQRQQSLSASVLRAAEDDDEDGADGSEAQVSVACRLYLGHPAVSSIQEFASDRGRDPSADQSRLTTGAAELDLKSPPDIRGHRDAKHSSPKFLFAFNHTAQDNRATLQEASHSMKSGDLACTTLLTPLRAEYDARQLIIEVIEVRRPLQAAAGQSALQAKQRQLREQSGAAATGTASATGGISMSPRSNRSPTRFAEAPARSPVVSGLNASPTMGSPSFLSTGTPPSPTLTGLNSPDSPGRKPNASTARQLDVDNVVVVVRFTNAPTASTRVAVLAMQQFLFAVNTGAVSGVVKARRIDLRAATSAEGTNPGGTGGGASPPTRSKTTKDKSPPGSTSSSSAVVWSMLLDMQREDLHRLCDTAYLEEEQILVEKTEEDRIQALVLQGLLTAEEGAEALEQSFSPFRGLLTPTNNDLEALKARKTGPKLTEMKENEFAAHHAALVANANPSGADAAASPPLKRTMSQVIRSLGLESTAAAAAAMAVTTTNEDGTAALGSPNAKRLIPGDGDGSPIEEATMHMDDPEENCASPGETRSEDDEDEDDEEDDGSGNEVSKPDETDEESGGSDADEAVSMADRFYVLHKKYHGLHKPLPTPVTDVPANFQDVNLGCTLCVYSRPAIFCVDCGVVLCKSCHLFVHGATAEEEAPGAEGANKKKKKAKKRQSLSKSLNNKALGIEADEPPHRCVWLEVLARQIAKERGERAAQEAREQQAKREAEERAAHEEQLRRNQHIAFDLMKDSDPADTGKSASIVHAQRQQRRRRPSSLPSAELDAEYRLQAERLSSAVNVDMLTSSITQTWDAIGDSEEDHGDPAAFLQKKIDQFVALAMTALPQQATESRSKNFAEASFLAPSPATSGADSPGSGADNANSMREHVERHLRSKFKAIIKKQLDDAAESVAMSSPPRQEDSTSLTPRASRTRSDDATTTSTKKSALLRRLQQAASVMAAAAVAEESEELASDAGGSRSTPGSPDNLSFAGGAGSLLSIAPPPTRVTAGLHAPQSESRNGFTMPPTALPHGGGAALSASLNMGPVTAQSPKSPRNTTVTVSSTTPRSTKAAVASSPKAASTGNHRSTAGGSTPPPRTSKLTAAEVTSQQLVSSLFDGDDDGDEGGIGDAMRDALSHNLPSGLRFASSPPAALVGNGGRGVISAVAASRLTSSGALPPPTAGTTVVSPTGGITTTTTMDVGRPLAPVLGARPKLAAVVLPTRNTASTLSAAVLASVNTTAHYFALIFCISHFDDDNIASLPPHVMHQADMLKGTLQGVGYRVKIMHSHDPKSPAVTAAPVPPTQPTMAMMLQTVQSLQSRMTDPKASLLVCVLSRGTRVSSNAMGTRRSFALAFDSRLASAAMTLKSVVTSSTFSDIKDPLGRSPTVFVDASPVFGCPNACETPAAGVGWLSPSVGSNFVLLGVVYGPQQQGWLSYHVARALSGRALGDVASDHVTFDQVVAFVARKVSSKGCTVSYSAPPLLPIQLVVAASGEGTTKPLEIDNNVVLTQLSGLPAAHINHAELSALQMSNGDPVPDPHAEEFLTFASITKCVSSRWTFPFPQLRKLGPADLQQSKQAEATSALCRVHIRLMYFVGPTVEPVSGGGPPARISLFVRKSLTQAVLGNKGSSSPAHSSPLLSRRTGASSSPAMLKKSTSNQRNKSFASALTEAVSVFAVRTVHRREHFVRAYFIGDAQSMHRDRSKRDKLDKVLSALKDPSYFDATRGGGLTNIMSMSASSAAVMSAMSSRGNLLSIPNSNADANVAKYFDEPSFQGNTNGIVVHLSMAQANIATPSAEHHARIVQLCESGELSKGSKLISAVAIPFDITACCTLKGYRRALKVLYAQPFLRTFLIESVTMDDFDERAHLLITKVQATVRRFLALRKSNRMKSIINGELAAREAITDARCKWWVAHIANYFFTRAMQLVEDHATQKRSEVLHEWHEMVLVIDGKRVAEVQQRESILRRQMIRVAEWQGTYLLEHLYRERVEVYARKEAASVVNRHRFGFRYFWSRYRIEYRWYQETLSMRNAMRAVLVSAVDEVMPIGVPPTTFEFASGFGLSVAKWGQENRAGGRAMTTVSASASPEATTNGRPSGSPSRRVADAGAGARRSPTLLSPDDIFAMLDV